MGQIPGWLRTFACEHAHSTDREALTPVAPPRTQKTRKTPTPTKMKTPARCLGRTAARTSKTTFGKLRAACYARDARVTRPCRIRMASHTTMRPASTSAIAGTSIATTSAEQATCNGWHRAVQHRGGALEASE